jgi:hypothetical protein
LLALCRDCLEVSDVGPFVGPELEDGPAMPASTP